MKFIKSLFTGLLVCGFVLAMAGTSRAEDKPTPAKVVRIKGSARFTTDNHTWHPLEVGQVLQPGSVIQTGEASMVDIILGEGDVDPNPAPMGNSASYTPHVEQDLIRLWDNTTMSIDKLTQTQTGADTMTDTQLDLRAGTIFGTVKKISPTSKYEIKIPNGIAGIRGTIYMVSAGGVVAVLQGSVIVSYIDSTGQPATKQVDKGYEFNTQTGELKPLSELHIGDLIRLAFESKLVINKPTTVVNQNGGFDVSPVKP